MRHTQRGEPEEAMSALLDALMNREPLSHALARETREVDYEFRRRYVQSHPEFSAAEVSAVLGAAVMPLIKAARLNGTDEAVEQVEG